MNFDVGFSQFIHSFILNQTQSPYLHTNKTNENKMIKLIRRNQLKNKGRNRGKNTLHNYRTMNARNHKLNAQKIVRT